MQILSPNGLYRGHPPKVGRGICSALVIVACLTASGVQAADQGPHHHAQGQYDTATYVVVEGG